MKFIKKNGKRLGVLRPADPQKALELVFDIQRRLDSGEITSEQAFQEFQVIPLTQDYIFIGYLAEVGFVHLIVDADMNVLEPMQPGDSMVSEDGLGYIQAPQA